MTIPPVPMAKADQSPNQSPDHGAFPRALVAFSGQTELAWLHLLRPGYRHCFVLVESPGPQGAASPDPAWVLYNPLSSGTQIAVWSPIDEDTVRAWLCQQDYTVVETYAHPITARVFGWRPYTCVEAVKRVLGLHAPTVFTPWQLYRHIKKSTNRNINIDIPNKLGYKSS